jgi:hypothetical protein
MRGRFSSAVLSWGDFLMPDTGAHADRQNAGELERAASGLAGAVLLGYGLVRPIGGALLL